MTQIFKKILYILFIMLLIEISALLLNYPLFYFLPLNFVFFELFVRINLVFLYFFVTYIISNRFNLNKGPQLYILPSVCAFFMHTAVSLIIYEKFIVAEIIFSLVIALASSLSILIREKKCGKIAMPVFLVLSATYLFVSINLNHKPLLKDDLLIAIQQRSIYKVKTLLEEGVDVNDDSSLKGAPIVWAAFKGDVDIIEMLLSYGANCTIKSVISLDSSGRIYPTALAAAVGEGNYKAAKYLLNNCDFNINEKVAVNKPLFYPNKIISVEKIAEIICNSDDEVAKFLRKKIKNFQSDPSKELETTLKDVPKVIMTYFLNDLYIKWIDENGTETILEELIQRRKRVDKLFEGLVKPNKCETLICEDGFYRPILEYAVSTNSPDLVKLLIKHGANVNDVDSYGAPPIFGAPLNIAKILIENGADGKIVLPYFKASIIESLVRALDLSKPEIMNELQEIILLLVNDGANINHINKKGETVLYSACEKEVKELALFLYKNGADADIKVDEKIIRDYCREKDIIFNKE